MCSLICSCINLPVSPNYIDLIATLAGNLLGKAYQLFDIMLISKSVKPIRDIVCETKQDGVL